jgi:hypothetical protein
VLPVGGGVVFSWGGKNDWKKKTHCAVLSPAATPNYGPMERVQKDKQQNFRTLIYSFFSYLTVEVVFKSIIVTAHAGNHQYTAFE